SITMSLGGEIAKKALPFAGFCPLHNDATSLWQACGDGEVQCSPLQAAARPPPESHLIDRSFGRTPP
ncbi:hypothetical protein, partial [Mesorhizobium sp.]|uniref:hypothetical protein n=1 Tax=Mesorhizobium sp. TaxID=1871066 RepID=UPI0025E7AC0B